ncbi:MAG: hypothetical protein HY692_06585 [Cyanobacteria bacterium NC_groundwater_1444_Ag_S-0.65um_54_12]|nr:hypothetical protein [Cyanobacteria bacterium NC_groundwater_1444_Ag_S-0.65um_54_12]
MPVVQTVIFESVEVDVTSNKQLFIHPIHRVIAEEFPANVSLAVLSCCYDLKPGQYSCHHALLSPDKKKTLIDFNHEAVKLEVEGGGMGFRTTFEEVLIEGPGKYWIKVDISGGLRGDDVLLRVEERKKGAPRLNMRA